jgi:hypothetical protein
MSHDILVASGELLIPRMAFARRTVAESAGLNHRLSRRSRIYGSKLAIHRRYTERRFLCIPYCYLQGITVRPVPCNYFHGGNTGSNPVGDAKPFQELASNRRNFRRHKKAQL